MTTFASYFVSGSFQQPSPGHDLFKEGVRLASFRDFPPTVPVSALRLAQAGFFYTGRGDQVECFACGMTHQDWQLGDRPAVVHARIAPSCPLVRGEDATNVPLPLPLTSLPVFESVDSGYGSAPPESSHSQPPGPTSAASSSSTTSGGGGSVALTFTEPDASSGQSQIATAVSGNVPNTPSQTQDQPRPTPSQTATVVGTTGSSGTSGSAPVLSSIATPENSVFSGAPLHGPATPMDGGAPRNLPLPARRLDLAGAVYPLYSQLEARKRSFTAWTARPGLPAVDELVTLGFFYAGYADCVRCFFCGIGLKSWEVDDVPAEVHARWRPTCEYLRLVKGDEYVDSVVLASERIAVDSAPNPPPSAGVRAPSTGNSGRDNAQQAPNNSSSGQQGSAPSVPEVPVVRRARDLGYTNQQITDAIQQLRTLGIESAMDTMLVEVLSNLFPDILPRRTGSNGQSGGNTGNGGGGSGNTVTDAVPSARDTDMQNDGEQANSSSGPEDPAALQARHNALRQENARLRDMRLCQTCRQRTVGVIFLPCGHITSCSTCAPNIRRCDRCDTVIRATANVFFS